MMKRLAGVLSGILVAAALGAGLVAQATKFPIAAPAISVPALLEHVKVLSSDQFEGRAPGTHGEDLTVAYIEDHFKKVGL